MIKRSVIRVGDTVRVLRAVSPVLRVGYALHWTEVSFDEFPDLKEIAKSALKCSAANRDRINEALQREVVERKGFGGRDRVIVRDLESDMIPAGEYTVLGKKRKMLGKYHPPSQSITWDSVYDYAGGYIADATVVHLLDVAPVGTSNAFIVPKTIASIDCEKVEP